MERRVEIQNALETSAKIGMYFRAMDKAIFTYVGWSILDTEAEGWQDYHAAMPGERYDFGMIDPFFLMLLKG